jgi:2,3-bisphosphoglycerate-independent phosphoglycerate mutase
MLVILDGWGFAGASTENAVTAARTPVLNRLAAEYPSSRLTCAGESVGLPPGVMGNSEVGHMNIGAGRIVYQDLLRIDRAIAEGSFFENPNLKRAMDTAAETGATLHLMGLLSDGGVHSHISHLLALVRMADRGGVGRIRIHAILDGRDTPPNSGRAYVQDLSEAVAPLRSTAIASLCGRFYAMDRDNRWERIAQAYRLYTRGEGRVEQDPVDAVDRAYRLGETDEFVKPVVLADGQGSALGRIRDGDVVVFFNFRADRAREMTRAFTEEGFDAFDRSPVPALGAYVCMTEYDATFGLPAAFPPVRLEGILGEAVSRRGLRQLRIAETEKYAHVTYFFNGGEETPFEGEDRCLIPSPRDIETYDLRPEMSAPAVAAELRSRIAGDGYAFVVVNFANMDMVGHTGNLDAAVAACETVDRCVGEVLDPWLARGGTALVTADHGNAEAMRHPDGTPHTAHTTNPVPFLLIDPRDRGRRLRGEGILADIAPTVLALMGLPQPPEMTGKSFV